MNSGALLRGQRRKQAITEWDSSGCGDNGAVEQEGQGGDEREENEAEDKRRGRMRGKAGGWTIVMFGQD